MQMICFRIYRHCSFFVLDNGFILFPIVCLSWAGLARYSENFVFSEDWQDVPILVLYLLSDCWLVFHGFLSQFVSTGKFEVTNRAGFSFFSNFDDELLDEGGFMIDIFLRLIFLSRNFVAEKCNTYLTVAVLDRGTVNLCGLS